MTASGSAKQKQQRDKQQAAFMKAHGIERRTGRCPVCYGIVPNDTFGGAGMQNHMSAHARGYVEKKHKAA